VILYTGYTEKITQAVLDSAGVGALLQKPIQPAALFEFLGRHLQQG
jgi:hypothetical protein